MSVCGGVRASLSAFRDGELDDAQVHAVAAHLGACSSCGAALSEYEAVGRLLVEVHQLPSLDGFAAGVRSRIERLVPPRQGWRAGFASRRIGIRRGLALPLAAGLAAAAALAVLTWGLRPWKAPGFELAARQPPAMTANPVAPSRPWEAGYGAASAGALETAEAVISVLETEKPLVAVWSEPLSKTMVIWMPEQP